MTRSSTAIGSIAAILVLASSAPCLAQTPVPVASAVPAAIASPAVAAPAGPPSPVQLDLCRVEYNHFGPFGLIKTIGALNIKFTNEGDKVIEVARIAVNFNQNQLSIRDVGTFSPNITINHHFRDLTGENTKFGFSHEDQPTCFISFLKFADGTFWQSPNGPDDSGPAANVPAASPSPSASPAPQAATSTTP